MAWDTLRNDGETVPGSDWNDFVAHTKAVVNVKDYKCQDGLSVAGNGSHDDTTGIQAAITALPASGGTIFFPPGEYLVNTVTTVNGVASGLQTGTKKVKFVGTGGTAFNNGVGSSDRAVSRLITTASLWLVNVGTGTRQQGFSAELMGFADMSNSGIGGVALGAIGIYAVDGYRIRDCTFTNFAATNAAGVQIQGTSSICGLLSGNVLVKCYYGVNGIGAGVTALNIYGGFMCWGSGSPAQPAGATAINYTGDTMSAVGVAIDDYNTGIKLGTLGSNAVIGCRFEENVKAIVINDSGRNSIIGNRIISSKASACAMEVNATANILYPKTDGTNSIYLASPLAGSVAGVKDNTGSYRDNGTSPQIWF